MGEAARLLDFRSVLRAWNGCQLSLDAALMQKPV